MIWCYQRFPTPNTQEPFKALIIGESANYWRLKYGNSEQVFQANKGACSEFGPNGEPLKQAKPVAKEKRKDSKGRRTQQAQKTRYAKRHTAALETSTDNQEVDGK